MGASESPNDRPKAALAAHVLVVGFRDEVCRIAASTYAAQVTDLMAVLKRLPSSVQVRKLVRNDSVRRVCCEALARASTRAQCFLQADLGLNLGVHPRGATHDAYTSKVTARRRDFNAAGLVQVCKCIGCDVARDGVDA